MKMHQDKIGNNLVTDYGASGISINGKTYTSDLIVNSSTLTHPWEITSIEELTLLDLEPALSLKPEILILGTGTDHVFPPMKLQVEVSSRGCALEVMSTSAACRTYNVLVGEYRQVAAAFVQLS